ncbi:MAG: hypothetical protein H6699_03340 [Myxococcales bacterium]|nr:hypothetical protein [Myxococcales bacterium]
MAALISFGAASCGAAGAHEGTRQPAVLLFPDLPSVAEVWLDDEPHANPAVFGGALVVAPGEHRLLVRMPGTLDVRLDVRTVAGGRYTVQVPQWPCFSELDRGCTPAAEDRSPNEN